MQSYFTFKGIIEVIYLLYLLQAKIKLNINRNVFSKAIMNPLNIQTTFLG
jgi:hypothetical protein